MASKRLAWAGAAAAAAGLLYVAYRHSSRPRLQPFSLIERKEAAGHKKAFVLAVNLRFANELQKLHFLSIWRPLAEYVKAAEPVTLSFELLEADNNPCFVMVYERYLDRDAYESIHRTSPAFLAFKAAMADLPFKVDLVGQSFIESDIGFML